MTTQATEEEQPSKKKETRNEKHVIEQRESLLKAWEINVSHYLFLPFIKGLSFQGTSLTRTFASLTVSYFASSLTWTEY